MYQLKVMYNSGLRKKDNIMEQEYHSFLFDIRPVDEADAIPVEVSVATIQFSSSVNNTELAILSPLITLLFFLYY